MSGETVMCNRALLGFGIEAITSYKTSKHDNAILCRRLLPDIRKEVLSRWEWDCNTAYADLGAELTGDSLIEGAEWEYQFNLPAVLGECLRVVAQTSEDNHEAKYKFEVIQGILLTNDLTNEDEDSAYIKYLFLQEDASKYSPLLHKAMSIRLAAELAPKLKDLKTALDLLQTYEALFLPIAKEENQSEKYDESEEGETEWLDARTS